MSKRYLLGIDKGTSTIKAGLIAFSGNVIAIQRQNTPVVNLQSGWHEEDMEGTWRVTLEVIRDLTARSGVDPQEIAAIGISGHMTGVWLINAEGKPVRNAICWPDSRSIDILLRWEHEGILERFFEISGNAATTGMTLVVLRWLKENEPVSMEKTRFILCAKDWIRYKMTGDICTDESDVSHMPGDIHQRSYSRELMELCGISEYESLLPTISLCTKVVGGVLPKVAQEIGLLPNTPVVVGLGDAVANSIGTGLLQEGQAASILGTSLMNIVVTNRPILQPQNVGFEMAMVDDKWIRLLPNYGGGTLNLDWFLNNFCSLEENKAATSRTNIFDVLEQEAAKVPIGSNGIIYHPYLNKTGVIAPFNNPTARGQFFGLSVQNTRQDLLRAVYEGVAFSMFDCYQAIPVPIKDVRLSGGGAKSVLWCQIISDCLGIPVIILSGAESGVMGVALAAGVGVGVYSNFKSAVDDSLKIERIYEPKEEATSVYREIYSLYRKLRKDLSPHWRLRKSIYGT